MTTVIDLDDLPPKVAQMLTGAAVGEEIVLVRGGAVVGRLIVGASAPQPEPEPQASPDVQAAEVFEHFRSAIEEEF